MIEQVVAVVVQKVGSYVLKTVTKNFFESKKLRCLLWFRTKKTQPKRRQRNVYCDFYREYKHEKSLLQKARLVTNQLIALKHHDIVETSCSKRERRK